MTPPSETVHWMFATGILFLGLLKLAEAIAGPAVWGRRLWRVSAIRGSARPRATAIGTMRMIRPGL